MLTKKRKEVSLDIQTLDFLESQAKQAGRSLKNYLEFILIEKANDLKLSKAYKARMDTYLEKEASGAVKYVSEQEAEEQLGFKL